MNLSVTPHAGDTIYLPFIDEKKKFAFGTVHSVFHDIRPDKQVITIDVHPFLPFVAKWKKDKETYEYQERQRKHNWD